MGKLILIIALLAVGYYVWTNFDSISSSVQSGVKSEKTIYGVNQGRANAQNDVNQVLEQY